MGVSLILLRRARTGIALSRCGWVCVYAPMWPGTWFWGYPFLDPRPERRPGWVSVTNTIWCRLLPARFLFSAFLRRSAQSSRAISLVIVVFRLAVIFVFHRGPTQPGLGRPQDRFSAAGSCAKRVLRAAGGCASAENGGASFSASFSRMLVFLRANRSFQGVFGFSRRRRESVCVCVCVCVCVSSIHCLA